MATFNVESASNDELISEQQRLAAEELEVSLSFKQQKKAIQNELDRRAALERFSGLTDAELDAIDEIRARRQAQPEDEE